MPAKSIVRYLSVLGAFMLTGCVASQGALPSPISEPIKYTSVEAAVAALNADNKEEATGVPRIHLNLLGNVSATNYVDASFQVSEDAYVMIVAVDLDRRVRVVFPEAPEESGFVTSDKSRHLTRFFAGFGSLATMGRNSNFYNATQRISRYGGSGVLLAIASDRPLQFDRLVGDDGDWNEDEIARRVFDTSAPSAAYALGRAVSMTGQAFNTDYSAFRGQSAGFGALASNSFNDCGAITDYSDYGLTDSYLSAFTLGSVTPYVTYFRANGILYAQYQYSGRCGQPYYSAPVPVREQPAMPRDTTHRDTALVNTYRGRIAERSATPRVPVSSIETTSADRRTATHPTAGFRVPRTPITGETTAQVHDEGRIRFRTPEQVIQRPILREAAGERREPMAREPMQQTRSEPVHVQQPRSEPIVRTEPVRSEPVRSEPVRAEPVRTEVAPPRTAQPKAEPNH